ncbi:MAG: DNA recombination protein RmuC [Dehalococcoidia bacterium]|nr:DNA recombination protein RmuC [Dehalococcoidia bacterium]
MDYVMGRMDLNFQNMKGELDKVSNLVYTLEKDRVSKFGELTTQLKEIGKQTEALTDSTRTLREALANPRSRGQWGERMAEDILGLIGFKESVNYRKQSTIVGTGSRPDFTFLLPRNQILNMDVKFPLDNYLRFMETETPQEKEPFRRAFLKDVRTRLNEVITRDYINSEQNTLACVLLFIPNEQVYHFILEQDDSVIDEALKNQVVLCSPLTLFAILAVIRQAVDNFTIEQTSNQIISEMGAFKEQWDKFLDKLGDVGKRIESTQKEYQSLITTRRRALERPLNRIETLRKEQGLGLPVDLVDEEEQITVDVAELK